MFESTAVACMPTLAIVIAVSTGRGTPTTTEPAIATACAPASGFNRAAATAPDVVEAADPLSAADLPLAGVTAPIDVLAELPTRGSARAFPRLPAVVVASCDPIAAPAPMTTLPARQ